MILVILVKHILVENQTSNGLQMKKKIMKIVHVFQFLISSSIVSTSSLMEKKHNNNLNRKLLRYSSFNVQHIILVYSDI
jgi:hypothetical protein